METHFTPTDSGQIMYKNLFRIKLNIAELHQFAKHYWGMLLFNLREMTRLSSA